ncbi:MAG: hypothetical protein U1A27_07200 [Phycisphaerae bacterium]
MTRRGNDYLGVCGFLIAAAVVGLGPLSMHRAERDGWRLRWYCPFFACAVCVGQINELTCKGVPLKPPAWSWKSVDSQSAVMYLVTPVGAFRALGVGEPWRLSPNIVQWNERTQRITPDELAQGWCSALPSDRTNFIDGCGPYVRPAGVPADWCLIVNTGGAGRWVRADKAGGLAW